MESTRQKKVGKLIQKDLSDIFIKDLKELVTGAMVTVTLVRISPDLGLAKVYLSIFPSANAQEKVDKISEAASRVRGVLGNRIGKQMRVVPELKFYLDDSLDYLDNIDKLLKE